MENAVDKKKGKNELQNEQHVNAIQFVGWESSFSLKLAWELSQAAQPTSSSRQGIGRFRQF